MAEFSSDSHMIVCFGVSNPGLLCIMCKAQRTTAVRTPARKTREPCEFTPPELMFHRTSIGFSRVTHLDSKCFFGSKQAVVSL